MRAKRTLTGSEAFAVEAVSRMLGTPLDDSASQNRRATHWAKIGNIVAGYFKAKAGLGDPGMLSRSTIISGRHDWVHSRDGFDHLRVRAAYREACSAGQLEITR